MACLVEEGDEVSLQLLDTIRGGLLSDSVPASRRVCSLAASDPAQLPVAPSAIVRPHGSPALIYSCADCDQNMVVPFPSPCIVLTGCCWLHFATQGNLRMKMHACGV